MTAFERKVRMDVARGILSAVQTDICNEWPPVVGKEDCRELTDIIIRLTVLASKIENAVPAED